MQEAAKVHSPEQKKTTDALALDAARDAERTATAAAREALQEQAEKEEFEAARNAPAPGTADYEHAQRFDTADEPEHHTPIQKTSPVPAQPVPLAPEPAPEAQQPEQPTALDEEKPIQSPAPAPAPAPEPAPEIDCLADIHKQIATAIAAAHEHSRLARAEAKMADVNAEDWGALIIANNADFVAVQSSNAVKIYSIDELNKRLSYDGTDATDGKFAPGNEITRKNSRDGIRTVLTEEREHAQTQEVRSGKGGGGIAD